MSLKDRTIKSIKKMVALVETKEAEMQKVKNQRYMEIANGIHVAISPEQIASNANAVRDAYNEQIAIIQENLMQEIEAAKMGVNQKYYKALRTPTADERAEIEHIVKTYNANNSIDAQRDIKFQNTRDFHLKNKTEKAFVYCVASVEIYGDKKKLPMFDTVENESVDYDVMPDEWLQVVNPEVLTLKDEMIDVLEAEREVETYGLYQFKDSATLTDFQVITIKTRLSALGARPNMGLIEYYHSEHWEGGKNS